MHKQVDSEIETRPPTLSPSDDYELSSSHGTIVQLTENFRLNPDLGEFVSTIYSRQFKPQKVQARQIGTALKRVELDIGKDFGLPTDILQAVQSFLVSLSNVMSRKPQTSLRPPTASHSVPPLSQEGSLDFTLTHYPVSLSLIRLQTWSQRSQHFGYEMHVRGEAAVAASLVASIRRCCPTEGIFVATPHRIQREAVRTAISRINLEEGSLDAAFSRLHVNDVEEGRVTVDTIERLQGSEAGFVICLFSISKSFESDLGFLLERRRLNVAISRAKTLCILITSEEVLRPSVKILANEETAKGYAFLKAFEDRAWSYELNVDLDKL
ncbi:AAA domain-containing protein [Crucibulum laeve]|uniref:AAA domain-containing protein n=1 Tax=Crucibulum laeve TaxID=68775 RepID=A0A5C3MKL8_9AGAR|nr:AAA domain-containing protein [Crucibulum laeve]